MQISTEKMKKIGNSIFQSRKNADDFWLKFWDWRTVQRSALCRSRRELSNEYLLAKIGVDTAGNEPVEVWAKIQLVITIHLPPLQPFIPSGRPRLIPLGAPWKSAERIVRINLLLVGKPTENHPWNRFNGALIYACHYKNCPVGSSWKKTQRGKWRQVDGGNSSTSNAAYLGDL